MKHLFLFLFLLLSFQTQSQITTMTFAQGYMLFEKELTIFDSPKQFYISTDSTITVNTLVFKMDSMEVVNNRFHAYLKGGLEMWYIADDNAVLFITSKNMRIVLWKTRQDTWLIHLD